LIFGNRSISDILVQDELQGFADNYKENFKLFLTVDLAPGETSNWKGGVGFVT